MDEKDWIEKVLQGDAAAFERPGQAGTRRGWWLSCGTCSAAATTRATPPRTPSSRLMSGWASSTARAASRAGCSPSPTTAASTCCAASGVSAVSGSRETAGDPSAVGRPPPGDRGVADLAAGPAQGHPPGAVGAGPEVQRGLRHRRRSRPCSAARNRPCACTCSTPGEN